MSDIKPITSNNKRKLVELTNKVAHLVTAENYHPTDALIKAAGDGEYPPDFLLRAAEAFNGSAHLLHFKSASEDNRGDSFPICDGQAAVKKLYESQKVSTTVYEAPDFDVYLPEAGNYFQSKLEMPKTAAATENLPDIKELLKLAASHAANEKLDITRYRNLYNNASNDLASGILKFRAKTASVSESRRAEWAREAIEKFGSGSTTLELISLITGVSTDKCTKQAAQKVGFFSLGNEDVKTVFSLIEESNQATLLHRKLAQAEADHYIHNIERDRGFRDAIGTNKQSNIVTDVQGILSSPEGGSGDDRSAKSKALNTLIDPDFVRATSGIDRALALKKIIATDPVINKRNPHEINNALSEISEVAPTATMYSAMLRSMLRKRLELGSQMSDLDLNQMVNMEKGVRENETLNVLPKVPGENDKDLKGV